MSNAKKTFKEKSFVAIKTDGIQRSLVGEIISRFEKAGLKIAAMKMFVPDKDKAMEHYGKNDEWYESKGKIFIDNLKSQDKEPEKEAIEYGKDIIRGVVNYFSAGPVVAMIIEGPHAVGIVKKLVGGTEPLTSDVGTIRGDFTVDSYPMANIDKRGVRNLIHCSDEIEEAKREISIWFDEKDIINYRHIHEAMLYDVDIDGYLE